jgi:hypothetical protein
VPITTKVVSLNPVHGEVYSIQHYVIVCQRLETGQWFSPGTLISSTNKTGRHDITEILLKVTLNTINQTYSISSACIISKLCKVWFSLGTLVWPLGTNLSMKTSDNFERSIIHWKPGLSNHYLEKIITLTEDAAVIKLTE